MRQQKSPIKILYTIPNFITAGSGQAMFNIARRLDPERFSPSIAVLKTGGKLESDISAAGIPLLELPLTVAPRPLYSLLLRINHAASHFRPYQFDIWHSFHYSDDYTEALIARRAGAKWIYTKKNMSWGSRAWRIRTLLARHIVAENTSMIEAFFAASSVKRKVRLVPRGVDTTVFHPDIPTRLYLRKRLSIGRDEVVIGMVANLIPIKGHPVLLRALKEIPKARLLIAGKPLDMDYVRQLNQLVSELNLSERVHFLGQVYDVPALHAELDAFVLPTSTPGEGCGVALLEAMASGLPAIATNVGGPRDLIDRGVSGLLVPPDNPEALAQALLSLVRSRELRCSLGEGARKRVLAHYTIEREVEQHEAVYLELMGRN